jgi:tetratricopeptide (TPR) repeat protein
MPNSAPPKPSPPGDNNGAFLDDTAKVFEANDRPNEYPPPPQPPRHTSPYRPPPHIAEAQKLLDLAFDLQKQKDLEAAIRAFERASTLVPSEAQIPFEIGYLKLRLGDLAGAQAAWKAAIRADRRHIGAYFNLASSYAEQGELATAVRRGGLVALTKLFSSICYSPCWRWTPSQRPRTSPSASCVGGGGC